MQIEIPFFWVLAWNLHVGATRDAREICTLMENELKTRWDTLGCLNSGKHLWWTTYSDPIYCNGNLIRFGFFFLISFWVPLGCFVILILIVVIFLFWLNTGVNLFFHCACVSGGWCYQAGRGSSIWLTWISNFSSKCRFFSGTVKSIWTRTIWWLV